MADDVTLNTGTGGDVIAADDIGPGVKYQRVKVTLGADGVNNGDVAAANPMPVQISDGTDTALVSSGGRLSVETTGVTQTDAPTGSFPVGMGGRASTAVPTAVSLDDDVQHAWLTREGAVNVVNRNVSGTETGTASTPLRVDPTGSTTQPISAASLPLPTGAATSANQLPDGHNVTVDNASGASAVNIQDGGNSITVDDGGISLTVDGTVTANAGTGTFTCGGTAAHDAAVSGNPLLQGAEARTTNPTAVGNGDAVRIMADDLGRQVVVPHAVRDRTTHNTITLTSTTETTLIAAGGAGVFRDLVLLTLTNTSATAVRVDIRDSTAGTVRLSMFLAADGGGAVIPFPVPLNQATANNNWTAQLSAAVTDVRITAQAVENN